MATITKIYVEVSDDVRAQSDDAKNGYPFATDPKDFIIAPAEVEGLLPLRAPVYTTRALRADPTQNNAKILGLVAKNEAEFGAARKFVAARAAAEKTAQRAVSIWAAIEAGRAAAAERAEKLAKTA